jgi:hypothetical protein
MWKYRVRKGNERNGTEERYRKREREKVRKPKSRNIRSKIKLLAANLTARNKINYTLKGHDLHTDA